MVKAAILLLLTLCAAAGMAAESGHASRMHSPAVESKKLESELQSLNWKQFRFVVESVPKLRAEVDAYGTLGWEYVRANYQRHRWRKSIAKLDPAQRKQLAELIVTARRQRP